MAAYSLHAAGGTSTAAGTAAFLSRFDRQVDPDGTLAPEERARRAGYARKAYFSGLALRASLARSKPGAGVDQSPGESPASGTGRPSEAPPSRRPVRRPRAAA
jgi:hypothetical protein